MWLRQCFLVYTMVASSLAIACSASTSESWLVAYSRGQRLAGIVISLNSGRSFADGADGQYPSRSSQCFKCYSILVPTSMCRTYPCR